MTIDIGPNLVHLVEAVVSGLVIIAIAWFVMR